MGFLSRGTSSLGKEVVVDDDGGGGSVQEDFQDCFVVKSDTKVQKKTKEENVFLTYYDI